MNQKDDVSFETVLQNRMKVCLQAVTVFVGTVLRVIERKISPQSKIPKAGLSGLY
jgi:hypothetical protein